MHARIADIDIHYEISGQGPWLTLSHSLATHLGMWEPQLEALGRHFTLLRYDTRGHGGTSVTEGPYTLDQLADDVHGLLRHLGIARTHWLGLSMGGMIGQVLALRHPEVLDSVVLADTTGRVPAAGAAMWHDRVRIARSEGMAALEQPTLGRWFTDPFRAAQPALMQQIGTMIRTTPVAGYTGCCEAIAMTDTLEGLKGQRSPALVIVGDQDQATPPAAAQAIADHWPGARLVVLPDAAHLANIEQASAFSAAVLAFLTASGRS
jgi:3-oxoadipate enol-lactonase